MSAAGSPGPASRRRAGRPLKSAGEGAGLREIARGSTLNLVGAAVFAGTTLAITVLVTRQFSRGVAGAFFTATSLFLIVEALAGLGAYSGLVYFIARLRSLGGERRISIMLRAAIVPVAVSSLGSAVLLLALADPLARALLDGRRVSGASPAAVANALRILAIALPFAALLDTMLGASRGYRDMWPTVVLERIGRSALQLIGVLVAALSGAATLLAPLWAASYLPVAVVALLWLRRIRRRAIADDAADAKNDAALAATAASSADLLGDAQRPRESEADPRAFWLFTAPRALATVAQSVIQRLDIVLVGLIRGPVDAAVYTAATRFLVVGQLGNAAISMAAQPQFSALFARQDRRGANTVYQATTGWLIILTWPLYLLAIIYGPSLLSVFGHDYRAGATVIVILALAMLLSTACGQVDMVLTTSGRSSWSLCNGLLAVGVNVAVDLALIPHYGITGAAIGWAAAIVVSNLVPLAQLAWVVRVHPFGAGTLAACALSALSFCVVPLVARALLGGSAAASILAVAAGCGVLTAGLWRYRESLYLSATGGLRWRDGKQTDVAAVYAEQGEASRRG